MLLAAFWIPVYAGMATIKNSAVRIHANRTSQARQTRQAGAVGLPVMGAASFGVRPTVKTHGAPLLEVCLLDFQGNLYGRRIVVEFVERIRTEEKFDSLEIMTAQMHRDISAVRNVFATA